MKNKLGLAAISILAPLSALAEECRLSNFVPLIDSCVVAAKTTTPLKGQSSTCNVKLTAPQGTIFLPSSITSTRGNNEQRYRGDGDPKSTLKKDGSVLERQFPDRITMRNHCTTQGEKLGQNCRASLSISAMAVPVACIVPGTTIVVD